MYFPDSQTVKKIRCVSFTDRFNVDQPAQSSLHDDIEQPNVHCDWSRPNDPGASIWKLSLVSDVTKSLSARNERLTNV